MTIYMPYAKQTRQRVVVSDLPPRIAPHRFIVIFLTFVASIPIPARLHADEQVEVLAAAVDAWMANVEFKCTYRFRSGHSTSLKGAMAGQFLPFTKELPLWEATGIFVKKGKQVRCSREYVGGAVEDRGNANIVTGLSFDETTNGEFDLEYILNDRKVKVGDYVNISPRRSQLEGAPAPGVRSGALSPLFFMGNFVHPNPLRAFEHGAVSGQSLEKKVNVVDEDHLQVVLTQRTPEYDQIMEALFWTVPNPPVIEKGVLRSVEKTVQVSETHFMAADFVKCKGGMLASIVRAAVSTNSPKLWQVQEWVSQDLGDEPPKDEDFVVTIPPTTRVRGLREEVTPPTGEVRRLNVNDYSLQDIDPRTVDPALAEQLYRARHEQKRWPRFVISLVVLTVLGGIAVILWRKRSRSG